MKFIIETVSGRKGIKSFETLSDYVNFMTENGSKIKTIVEGDLPYTDKPVKLPTISKSKGWKQVDASTFGEINSDGEKGDCLLPKNGNSPFKDTASFETSKTSEKADTQEAPKVEKSDSPASENGSPKDWKDFKYEESNASSEKSSHKDCDKSCENSEDKKECEKDCEEHKEESKDDSNEEKKEKVNESAGDDEYERYATCSWCGEEFPTSDMRKEQDMGYLCHSCIKAIESREGDLDFEDDELDEGFRDGLKKAGKYAKGALVGAGLAATVAAGNPAMAQTQQNPHASDSDIVRVYDDGSVEDKYGNHFSADEWEDIKNGIDPYSDGDEIMAGEEAPEWMREALNDVFKSAGVIVEEETLDLTDLEETDGEAVKPEEDKESLEYAKKQVKAWEEYIRTQEYADDFYYSNGGYRHDSAQLAYWKQEVKKRTKPETEALNEPADGDIDEKTGNKQLMEDGYESNSVQELVASINPNAVFLGDGQNNHTHYWSFNFSRQGSEYMPSPNELNRIKSEIQKQSNGVLTALVQQGNRGQFIVYESPLKKGLNESDEQLEEEITPSRLYQYQESKSINFAILSADRSERSEEENEKLQEDLKNDIKKMGYWYTQVKGGYIETGDNDEKMEVDGENSFLVPLMTKDEAIELGKKYDQDTVLYRDASEGTLQYIYTNERAGKIGDSDMDFETQAGRKNMEVTRGKNVPFYTRLHKSNKPDLKIGFVPKDSGNED